MRKSNRPKTVQQVFRINHQIQAKEVRVLDDQGKQIDIMDLTRALEIAREEEKDVVEIARLANPPVVKVIDFRKFLYQQKKKKQEEKKGAKKSETKELRIGLFIDKHDLEIKLKKAREFIVDGDKVRFVVRFPFRLLSRKDLGEALLKKIVENLRDVAKVDREARMEGRQMTMMMSKGKVEGIKSTPEKVQDKTEPIITNSTA